MKLNDWIRQPAENETELQLLPGGGMTSILRTLGCVGDSLSSGELESQNDKGEKEYHDFYDYSWGQFLARDAGITVRNFSRGGMTAKQFLDSFGKECGFYDPANACQAYLVALGVNDILNGRGGPLGDAQDICMEDPAQNKETFAGWYGRILQQIKEMQPKARVFLMTMPREEGCWSAQKEEEKRRHAELLYRIAERFEFTYVLDFNRDAPLYDREFRQRYFVGGHMNVAGYLVTARIAECLIDRVIRTHPEDFLQTGFIGTPYHNPTVKW